MTPGLLDAIRSRGHWRVNFRPVTPEDLKQLPLDECDETVRTCAVELRGWDYPHYPGRRADDSNIERLDTYVQAWIDWHSHIEFWQMHGSSQFLHYRALTGDWRERETLFGVPAPVAGPPAPELGVIENLWVLAEAFEFLHRLHQRRGLYEHGADVGLTLVNGQGLPARSLRVDDPGRVPFSYPRTNAAQTLEYLRRLDPPQIEEPQANAVRAGLHFFEKFGWTPNPDILAADVDKLYRRR